MTGTPIPDAVSTRLQRIAELAREDRQRAFLSLAHHIDIELLREAFRRTRKDGAPGVDGQTAAAYEERLDENLQSLLDRFKSGTYKAPPVRRTYIPKGDGKKTRPIGIPTFEDKVLQRAVTMVLEAVYEQDFLDCSYGFRPGRSAHQALGALRQGLTAMGGGWVLELDIQSYFDTLDPSHLRSFLNQRVRDGVIRRATDKWLKAGVMEDGHVTHPDTGTPQGGVVSPLLANIYLHEVLDGWFERDVKPRLKGRAFMVRYADDAVLVFSNEVDARRVLAVLPKRFAKYGLTLHPTKTRLLYFRPRAGKSDGGPDPESFDFLGLRHIWARRRNGSWAVKRKTAASRFTRTLKRLAHWLRANRHQPVAWLHRLLTLKLRGHAAYFGISGNQAALRRLRYEAERLWKKWLARRGHRSRMNWPRFVRLAQRFPLPALRILHQC
jgi:group II intron reverse transcriptase/maturase